MVRGGCDAGEGAGAPQRLVGGEARATARRWGPAGAAKRSATPSRLVVEARLVPLAGRCYGRVVWGPGARSAPRWRARGRRRRSRARVARLSAGATEACGSIPARRRTAMFRASRRALWALPPWRAGLERAGPRPKGRPAWAQRSARPYHVHRQATATTLPSREGARVVRNVSGRACIARGTRIAPSWVKSQTSMVRACQARPQEN
jgi:hypothetical protein